jgi:hypothetical protein
MSAGAEVRPSAALRVGVTVDLAVQMARRRLNPFVRIEATGRKPVLAL